MGNFEAKTPCVCISMGSMGSIEPMEFWRQVSEPIDFEQIVKHTEKTRRVEVSFCNPLI